VVGRGRETDAPLPVMFVSRRHCVFTSRDGRVWVQDLESRNGTFVNGQSAVRPLPVSNRDEIRIGPLAFTVSLGVRQDETIDSPTPVTV
jgi:pSer/pThr/pTyr-binding forkhead associated (FHA) protein